MAAFCLATKMQPSEYKALTLYEYIAFMDILKPANDTDGYSQF